MLLIKILYLYKLIFITLKILDIIYNKYTKFTKIFLHKLFNHKILIK